MDYSGYALPTPVQCIIKWWQSVMMNKCNKGYSLGVCGRRWGQQAALNYWYLPTKLHCVCHGMLKSKRTLYHINITCGVGPSHVWRRSTSGMLHCEARWVLPEVLKLCSALEMSRPTYRMTERHMPDDSHFQQHSCDNVRSHKSALPCMCLSPEVLIILPFLVSPRTINDTAWGCHMLPNH